WHRHCVRTSAPLCLLSAHNTVTLMDNKTVRRGGEGERAKRAGEAISLRASNLVAPCTRHIQNQPRHPFRLIQLDEVLSAWDEEEFRLGEDLVESLGDALVQGGIGVAEDDPDRATELAQSGDLFCA